MEYPRERDRYDVFYVEPYALDDPRGPWISFISLTEDGSAYHGEMTASAVAAYRYRMKHRYARWSDLPDVVKARVLRDIEKMRAQS
ncbi:hypothetical protein MINTMi27_15510 [Mycobacterium intracellulare]|uniref:hypothetical protein n=1 Tax=Mycobacterium intracellulare TaxID=1767 RepID=UPI001925CAFB|nr:hypothetical protein [Mycobacterium intracellulare]BCP41458.1 hypothetical protein MINTMi27_15510 [Mycobacterium intracellulare]